MIPTSKTFSRMLENVTEVKKLFCRPLDMPSLGKYEHMKVDRVCIYWVIMESINSEFLSNIL